MARSVCSRTVDTATGELPQYQPPSAISSSVTSVTLALYVATFRPFWRLSFHNRYILTNLATFLKKSSLSFIWKMSPVLPRAASMRSVQCHLSLLLLWPVNGRETALSVSRNATDLLINHLQKQRFQAPVAYWLFWLLNVNIIRLSLCSVCYSDAGSVLNETKQ